MRSHRRADPESDIFFGPTKATHTDADGDTASNQYSRVGIGCHIGTPAPTRRKRWGTKTPASIITMPCQHGGGNPKASEPNENFAGLGAHVCVDDKVSPDCCISCPRALARAEILFCGVKTWQVVSNLTREISKGTRSARLNCGTCQALRSSRSRQPGRQLSTGVSTCQPGSRPPRHRLHPKLRLAWQGMH
jgi:hypothetical protein